MATPTPTGSALKTICTPHEGGGDIIHYLVCLKIAGWVANSIEPDEMLCSAASNLGLHVLLRPVCLKTYSKYGTGNAKHAGKKVSS